jgi:hypothetical protein
VPPGGWRETLPCGWLTCTADAQQFELTCPISHGATHADFVGGFMDVQVEQEALVLTYVGGAQVRARHVRGAEQVAECLRRRLSLPREAPPIQDVTEQELRENPGRWNGAWVRVCSRVSRGMEYRAFAGLWFSPLCPVPPEGDSLGLEVVGLVRHSETGRGFGHMGLHAGELVVVSARALPAE